MKKESVNCSGDKDKFGLCFTGSGVCCLYCDSILLCDEKRAKYGIKTKRCVDKLKGERGIICEFLF